MPSPINSSAVLFSLTVTLQRQLAARGVIVTSTVCEAIVAAQLDGIAALFTEASDVLTNRPRLRLVKTERATA